MNLFNRMPQVSIVFGILLTAVGVIGYKTTGSASVTALIPAFVGGLILVCGIIALNPAMLKHAMHGGAMLGLLGLLAGGGRFIGALIKGNTGSPAFIATGLMALLCGLYVFCCVQSFRQAKKARLAAAAGAAGQ